jgi:hypothetical protein
MQISISGTGTGGTPDFTMSLSPATASVSSGQSVNSTLVVLPLSGFNQTVSLSCSGAPTDASCTVTPLSQALDGTTPVTTALAIQTTARTAGLVAPHGSPPGASSSILIAFGCFVLTVCWILSSGRERSVRRLAPLCLFMAMALSLTPACGGSGGNQSNGGPPPPQGTQPGTYTITVTGASGTITQSTTFSLIVK